MYVGTRQGQVMALHKNEAGALQGEARVMWRFEPEENERLGGVFGTPAVGEEFVYVPDKGDREGVDGRIYKLRKERDSSTTLGKGEWVKPVAVGEIRGIVGGPALAEGLVIYGSDDGTLYARATGDGSLAWSFPTGGQVWSSPTVEGDTVYFGSMDRNVYALSVEEGRSPANRELWSYKTGGAVAAKPLVMDEGEMVVIGSFDRKLYALDANLGGPPLWEFKGDDWFWAAAVTDGERIFAATMSGTVYALDKAGQLAWSAPFKAESPIVSTPVVVDGNLVVATDAGRLHKLSAQTGEELELFKDLGNRAKAPLVSDGIMVFVGLEANRVLGINVETWDLVWEVATD